ncbi:T cell receptor alpha chain MC.7.G5-like [Hippocampus zosterae]|uniref:T cell receptor alpha chain MC.7.G5-like n=1 Tax=Hippocampus zosterae TaxID=109293 RepID=UPI00223D37BC|nr:T cell receptor alpha chain MC.7.G5-like [Hippocampus zosterae]
MCDVTTLERPCPSATKSAFTHTASADMSRALVCVLTAAWSLGISGQTVHQPEPEVPAVEGEAVTLGCSSDSSISTEYIFWYKQEVNSLPDFILSTSQFGQGKKGEKYADRYHCRMDASTWQAPLHIEHVKPSDSGVFYCALRPTLTHLLACLHKNTCTRLISWPQLPRHGLLMKTVLAHQSMAEKEGGLGDVSGGWRLLFGTGTRLTVETREDFDPSFYKLEASNLTACLATGFSQRNAMEKVGKGHMFEESRPVRISDDSLYNQVAVLTTAHNDTCEEGDSGQGQCQDALLPDEKVNLLSLAVLALRLVFAKTLAINCVMTLGLWFGATE